MNKEGKRLCMIWRVRWQKSTESAGVNIEMNRTKNEALVDPKSERISRNIRWRATTDVHHDEFGVKNLLGREGKSSPSRKTTK